MLYLRLLFLPFLPLLLLVGCGGGSPKSNNADQTGSQPTGESGPVLVVTCEQLAKDYEADEKAADAKYKDKLLEIDCFRRKVGSLSRPSSDQVAVDFPGHGELIVVAYIQGATVEKVLDTSPGQRVKLRGKGAGKFSILVSLVEGRVLEVGPDPATIVSAAQLGKELVADAEATAKKYEDKPLKVEGKIASVDPKKYELVLETGVTSPEGKPWLITAGFSLDWEKELEKLAVGKSATVRCVGGSLKELSFSLHQTSLVK